MKTNKPILSNALLLLVVLLIFQCCATDQPAKEVLNGGIDWPQHQLLPHFATPAKILDGLDIADKSLSPNERMMFSCLQGLINKNRPRIFLFGEEQEGKYKWPNLLGLSISEYMTENRWRIIKKYENELSGLILYNPAKSPHYRNIAASVGGIKNALPVTEKEMNELYINNIVLPVIEDISNLPYEKPEEIYAYFFDTYWPKCNHRMVVNLSPETTGHIRDYGVATQSAIVYLDPGIECQEIILRMFLNDMKENEGLLLGECDKMHTGRDICPEYNLTMLPAAYYENASVYSGMNHQVYLPSVPKKPHLENKIYLSVFMNGGDNIHYHQHTMSKLWDTKHRGAIPISWTISSCLADMGPAILNYYYKNATENDFFLSAPSGLAHAQNIEAIYNANKNIVASFDGSRPLFITAQGDPQQVTPEDIIALRDRLDLLSPGNVVMCRADHLLTLYNEAHGNEFNLAMLHNLSINSSPSFTSPQLVTDGSCGIGHAWISGEKERQWLAFDFKNIYQINRYIIRHAENMGMDKDFNTRKFFIETSTDGYHWYSVGEFKSNISAVTDMDILPVDARYLRLFIQDAGIDKRARICDMEIYGKAVQLPDEDK